MDQQEKASCCIAKYRTAGIGSIVASTTAHLRSGARRVWVDRAAAVEACKNQNLYKHTMRAAKQPNLRLLRLRSRARARPTPTERSRSIFVPRGENLYNVSRGDQ